MKTNMFDVLDELKITTGTIDKINIIKKHKDLVDLKQFFYLAVDERLTYGQKKLLEIKCSEPNPFEWKRFVQLCSDLCDRKLTGHTALKEISLFLNSCTEQQAVWCSLCIKKDLASIGIGASLINKAYNEKFILDFKCSGAKQEKDINKMVYPADAQWKVNGFRTFWFTDENGKVTESTFSHEKLPIGRSGLPISNFAFLNPYIEALGLKNKVIDGEVECDDNLQEIQSLFGFDLTLTEKDFIGKSGKVSKAWDTYQVRKAEVLDIQSRAKFRLFEVLDRTEFEAEDIKDNYITRREYLLTEIQPLIDKTKSDKISIIESVMVRNKKQAYSMAKKYIDSGKEGLVLKSHSGKYGFTKIDSQIKLKRQTNEIDVQIVGYELAKTCFKTNGDPYPPQAGRILIKYINDKNNTVESGVGTGKLLTRAFKLDFAAHPENYIGRIAIATAQEFTEDGLLSCPRLEELRPIQDKNKID